jgi:hypothetical protein
MADQRRRRSEPASITRRVYFYKCRLLSTEGQLRLFDVEAIHSALQALVKTKNQYQQVEDAEQLRVTPTRLGTRVGFSIGTVRNAGLPQVENLRDGSIVPLELTDDVGLVEQTHAVFFENDIVGVEFNFYGPRVQSLEKFLRDKCPTVPRFRADLLLSGDVYEEAQHLRNLRLMTFRIARSHVGLLSQMDESLMDFANGMMAATEADSVLLELKVDTPGEHLGRRALDFVLGLLGHEQQLKEGFSTFKIKGEDDRTSRVAEIDLLKDRLVSVQHVASVGARHRAVDSSEMFAAIISAHDELLEQIERAVRLET